jgi:ribosome-associated translation inhibitor RaiA
MQTEIKIFEINSDRLISDYVVRRLSFALSRFGERIGKVTTRIGVASNGVPRNVVCRITAEFYPFGLVTAEAIDPDAYSAIERSVSRLERQCQSKYSRSRRSGASRESIRIPTHKPAA